MLGIGKRLAADVLCAEQVAFANRTAATAIKGTGVARSSNTHACMVFGVGAMGAATTADFKIQESDILADGADWGDITGAAAVQIAGTQTNLVGLVDCPLTKKYVRCVHTPGGTVANGILGGCALILYGGQNLPQTNDPVAVIV